MIHPFEGPFGPLSSLLVVSKLIKIGHLCQFSLDKSGALHPGATVLLGKAERRKQEGQSSE